MECEDLEEVLVLQGTRRTFCVFSIKDGETILGVKEYL